MREKFVRNRELTEEDLHEMKKEIDEANSRVSVLTGENNTLFQQLKEDWGCTTVAQAETKLEKMKKNIEIIDKKIAAGIEELEAYLNVNETEEEE